MLREKPTILSSPQVTTLDWMHSFIITELELRHFTRVIMCHSNGAVIESRIVFNSALILALHWQ